MIGASSKVIIKLPAPRDLSKEVLMMYATTDHGENIAELHYSPENDACCSGTTQNAARLDVSQASPIRHDQTVYAEKHCT